MPTWSAPEDGVCAGRRQRGRLVRTSHATTSPLLSLRRPGMEVRERGSADEQSGFWFGAMG